MCLSTNFYLNSRVGEQRDIHAPLHTTCDSAGSQGPTVQSTGHAPQREDENVPAAIPAFSSRCILMQMTPCMNHAQRQLRPRPESVKLRQRRSFLLFRLAFWPPTEPSLMVFLQLPVSIAGEPTIGGSTHVGYSHLIARKSLP